MAAQAILGIVQALEGILAKIDVHGKIKFIKEGTALYHGENLVLLDGSSQLNLFPGWPVQLTVNQPVTIDGFSPLKPDISLLKQFIENAFEKGIDITQLLESLEPTSAGSEVPLGSGGAAFFLDPSYGSGQVTAGYDTIGRFSDNNTSVEPVVHWYGHSKPEAILNFSNTTLTADESLSVRNGDFNAADQAGVVDPFHYGKVIGFAEGFLVSGDSSRINPSAGVQSVYSLSLGNALSNLQASDGKPIFLSLDDQRIVGHSDGKVIFAVGIDSSSGKVTIVQYHGIYHPNPNSPDESIDLGGLITVTLTLTDKLGNISSASLDIGGKINFEDDAPFINSIEQLNLADNPALNTPLMGIIDVDFGSDLAKNLVFGENGLEILQNANLSSNGKALVFEIDSNSHLITAKVVDSDTIVFTLQLSNVIANAEQTHQPQYTLTIFDSVDQYEAHDEINLLIPVKAIDADNDSVIGNIQITIGDGANAAGGISTGFVAVEGYLGVDTPNGGYPVTTNHQFIIDAGVDRLLPESLILDQTNISQLINEISQELTSNYNPLTLSMVNNQGIMTLTATDSQNTIVFQMVITPDNVGKDLQIDVTFTQYQPLEHLAGGDSNGLVRQDDTSIHLGLELQAQDSDGDFLDNPVHLNLVINDGANPVLGNDQLGFTEERSIQTQNGQVPLTLGSDNIASLVFENTEAMQQSLEHLTSGGKTTSFSFAEAGRILILKIDDPSSPLDGQELLKVTLNTDGSYVAVLSGPLDQMNTDDLAELILTVRATDKDSDQSNLGQIKIIVNDAINQVYDTTAQTGLVEGDLAPATYPVEAPPAEFILQSSGDRLLPETISFDPNTIDALLAELSQEIKADGQALTFSLDGTVITGSLNGVAILVIELTAQQSLNHYDVDAQLNVTLHGPIDHNQTDSSGLVHLQGDEIIINVAVQIKDSDNDYLAQPALVQVSINDGPDPLLSTQENITLHEPIDTTAVTGQASFNIDVGSDAIKQIHFNYTAGEDSGFRSAGHEVLFEVDNDGVLRGYYLDGSTRVEVLRATLSSNDASGQVFFELFKPIDHNVQGQDSLTLNVKIQAIDNDGDATNLSLAIHIIDSIITPDDSTAEVIEGQTISGNLADYYNLNIEGGHLHTIRIADTEYSFATTDHHVIDTDKGQFTIHSNGSWELNAHRNLDHDFTQDLTIEYTLIDGDGDLSLPRQLVITINDGDPSEGGQSLSTSLNEGDLSPLTYPATVISAQLTIPNTGSDNFDLATLTILNQTALVDEINNHLKYFNIETGLEETVTATIDDNNILIKSVDGQLVLEIILTPVIQPNGNLLLQQTLILHQPLSHLVDYNSDYLVIYNDQISINYSLQISDIDGDLLVNPVTLQAAINDGANPDLIDTVATAVIDGASQSGGTINLDVGSDPISTIHFNDIQPALSGLTSNGNSTSVQISEHSIKIFDSSNMLLAEITLDNTGAYTIHLSGPLDQNVSNLLELPLQVTVTDKDGDSDTATLTVQIIDGANPEGGNVVNLTVTEGSLSGTPGYPVSNIQEFTIMAGSDRLVPQSLTIDSTVIASIIAELTAELTSAGQTITYTYNPATHSLTGTIGVETVLSLNLTATQNGQNVDVSITFTQYKPLDHSINGNDTGYVTVNGDTINIRTPVQIQDSDGDPLTNAIVVTTTIHDGALPLINTIEPVLVKESDISSTTTHIGSNSAGTGETASGQITVQEGSDQVVRYVLDIDAFNNQVDGSWTANGLPISLIPSSNTATTSTYSGVVTSGSNTVTKFTLLLNNITGSYTFTLLGAIDHPVEQGKNTLDLIFTVIAQDADGDHSAEGKLPIRVEDDIPTAADVSFSQITEGGRTNTVDLINNAREGADTGKIISVTDGETTYHLTGTGYNSFTIYDDPVTQNQVLGQLFIRADGSTYFVSNTNINHDSHVLNKQLDFNVRDFDGDTASARIIINIADKATTLSIVKAEGIEDVGRDSNEVIIDPAVGIPINMQINIGDFDNGESLANVLIRVPVNLHGEFYYEGAVLTTVVEGGVSYYVVPLSAFSTSDNINYTLNDLSFMPDADYSTPGMDFTIKVTIDTDSGPKTDVTGNLNIRVWAIADTPTWDMAQTTIHYTGTEDADNISLQLKGQLQDLDGSETIDYYLIKITEGNGVLTGTGLTQEGGYWKVSAANVNSLQIDPADDFSGIIQVEAIVVSKEASNFVPGQQYAQSEPIILTIDIKPDADLLKLNISKPYIVSNEDVIINMSNFINLSKAADNLDGSENSFVRISQIPDGAKLILHGVELDVSDLGTGLHDLSISYTDANGSHTITYQYYKDAANSSNDYFQINNQDLSALQLKPVPESNVNFTLKVTGVVIDSATLSTGQETDTKLTEAQFIDVNLKGISDAPVFDVTGSSWNLTPEGNVETTIQEDGQARLNFDVLSGEKALAPADTSETLTMVISGIPLGAELRDTDGNTLTLTYVGRDENGQPKYEVNLNSLSDLVLIPPPDSTADITLNAHLIVTENDGNALVVTKQIIVHIEPVIDAGDYSRVSTGVEDSTVTVNWRPPAFSDSQEYISGLKLENIPADGHLLINGVSVSNFGDSSVTLTAAQVQQLLAGALLQYQGPEDSDADVNLTAIVTVSQNDVDSSMIVSAEITGNLHLDIRAVVEPDAGLEVLDINGNPVTAITSYNGSTVDLSAGASSQGQIKFQDLDPSSVETIQTMVISGLGSQFVVTGGIYDGVGNWIIPASGLDDLQIISKHGYNGSINITIHAQVQDLGDNGEGDLSELATRQTELTLEFSGGGTGPGGPITEAGIITIGDLVITGQEDVLVDFGSQLQTVLSLEEGSTDDVYALIIDGPLPAGFSLTGSGVIYDFVNDRYVIRADVDGMGSLTLGEVNLQAPADYSGSLPFNINWVATNMESGDVNTGSAPVTIPVDIAPIVDTPTINLQIVQTEGLDADKQPGGNETYPNVAYEDGLITLNLNILLADNDGSEQINSVRVRVNPAQGELVDSNGNPLTLDGEGYVAIAVADLTNIKFKPVPDYSGPVTLSVQASIIDSTTNHQSTVVTDTATYNQDLQFNILPVNDPVIFSGPTQFTGNEDVSGGISFSGMTVNTHDQDGSETIVSLVIRGVPEGFLIGSAQNMGNGEWKVTVNSDNFELSDIKLIAPEHFSGNVNLEVTAYTKENLASLPEAAGTHSFSVEVHPVSDLVDIVGAGAFSELSGIENGEIIVTLNVETRDNTNAYTGSASNVTENAPEHLLITVHGVPEGAAIALPDSVNGQLLSQHFDEVSGTWTWVFEVIQTNLSNIVFLPGDNNGSMDLKIEVQSVDNNATAGPVKEIAVNVDVIAVNDAPENILPEEPLITQEDQALVINGLQIADIDAREDNGDMTVTLEVQNGSLTLGAMAGVTTGNNGSALVTLTGTIDAINALLANGVTYLGNQDFNGTDSLKMTTNDNGNSGEGSALTAESILEINVSAVNDAPVNILPLTPVTTAEDQAVVIHGLQISDVDAGDANMTVTLEVQHGTLNLGTLAGVTTDNNGSALVTLTGTIDAINALLANGVTYLGNQDFNGADSLKMTTNDHGNSGEGSALTAESILEINVSAVNDAPVNIVPLTPVTTAEDQAVVIHALQISDIDADDANMTVTLEVQHGTLNLGTMTGVTIDNNGSALVTLSGTVDAINTLLANGVSYQANADYHGPDSLTMTTNDHGNSGDGGELVDVDVVEFNITPRADVPDLSIVNLSIIAAIGALIPLQISAQVINPVDNELRVKLEGLPHSPVDFNGNPVGFDLGGNSWEIPAHQLSGLYLNNLNQGDYQIIVTAISDVALPGEQPEYSPSQTIQLSVVDSDHQTLEGGAGNDYIIGSDLNEVLVGIFGDDILVAQGGDDILLGGDGDDILIGGKGNDILTGGAGNDIFIWEAGDEGIQGMPAIDQITDFNPHEDKVDLSQLLQNIQSDNYTSYMHMEYDTDSDVTVLSISTQGQFNEADKAIDIAGKTYQVIMFQGVDLVGATPNQAEIINNLVMQNQIILGA